MYKEKLREIIVENYIQDKIDEKRFINLSEKAEKVSESKAEKILNEVRSDQLMGPIQAIKVMRDGSDKIFRSEIKKLKKAFKPKFDKCRSITDKNKRQTCFKIVGRQFIPALKNSMNNCNKSKNPDRCRKAFEREISAGEAIL